MPSVIDGTDNFDTGTDLVALTGADLTAVGIVGTNPYASLCKRDGSIVGGSDNGKFTKHVNGDLTVWDTQVSGSIVFAAGEMKTNVIPGWTYPIQFNTTPNGNVTVMSGWIFDFSGTFEGISINGMGGFHRKNNHTGSRTVTLRYNLQAIGRWK